MKTFAGVLAAFIVTVTSGSPTTRAAPPGSPTAGPPSAADATLTQLADDFFDRFLFPENPTLATEAGIHRYDSQLEDFSRAGVERQVKALHEYERRFAAVDPTRLSERVRGDRELMLASIRSTLLTLEVIRPWRTNPDTYSSAITGSAFSIMERNFASPNERLRHLIDRERLMPGALREARANLDNPPEIFTRIALQQLPGVTAFFEHDLPGAFAAADDRRLQAEFQSANAAVVAALKEYAAWTEKDLLPRSHGDFRLGERTFRAKLSYDEMVDTPLDRLLAIGTADLRRNQAEFARIAHELEPQKSTQQVLQELASRSPDPSHLLESFRATFDGLIAFIESHRIITIPSPVRPIVRETPPFMRATTFASMDTPGPFEPVATEAYFNVTLPEHGWSAERVRGFMAGFSYPLISNIAVHEAYPGHYVQFLWMHRVDDRVRKLIGASSNAEGWAHYCEQMMLDEGYGRPGTGAKSERDAKFLRLGQLQDALLRDARYLVAIQMHTGSMTLEQAQQLFVKEGYQSAEVAEVEAKRGTSDPTYLYYTLGKLQILKLRADLQAREGPAFRLADFHDAFMRQGFPPIKVVRRALLHDDSPTL